MMWKIRAPKSTLCALWRQDLEWAAHPFSYPPTPPPRRGRGEGGPYWRVNLTIMKWGWVFEKSRLLQALKFDKRWLKYTVRMEDCSYLCFLDDYRVCVKIGIFADPLLLRRVWRKEVWAGTCRRTPLHLGTGEGGRIGGDVVSYVEYTIAAVYDDAKKKFAVLATGF
jgi:hypothetical protein